jgi:hypothetical protein
MSVCCGPHKVQRISRPAEELLASERRLCCVGLLTNESTLKLASLSVGPSSLGVLPPSQLRMLADRVAETLFSVPSCRRAESDPATA